MTRRQGFPLPLLCLVVLIFILPQCRNDAPPRTEGEASSQTTSTTPPPPSVPSERTGAIEEFLSRWNRDAFRHAYNNDPERRSLVDDFVGRARAKGFEGTEFAPFAWGGVTPERGIATLLFWRLDPEGCATSARDVSTKGDFSGDGTLQAFVLLHAAPSLEAAFKEGLKLLGSPTTKAHQVGHRLCVMASLRPIPPDPFTPPASAEDKPSPPTLAAWKGIPPPLGPAAVVKGFLRRIHQRFVAQGTHPTGFLAQFVFDGMRELGRGEGPQGIFQESLADIEGLLDGIVPTDLSLEEYKAFFPMDMLVA